MHKCKCKVASECIYYSVYSIRSVLSEKVFRLDNVCWFCSFLGCKISVPVVHGSQTVQRGSKNRYYYCQRGTICRSDFSVFGYPCCVGLWSELTKQIVIRCYCVNVWEHVTPMQTQCKNKKIIHS